MTEITRYNKSDQRGLIEVTDGKLVNYEDHAAIVAEKDASIAALQEQVLALAADGAIMQAAIDQTIGWQQSVDAGNTESVRCLVAIQGKTPRIDAVLHEIRAQAIDDVAMRFHESAFVAFEYSDETGPFIRADLQQYAAAIRAGE